MGPQTAHSAHASPGKLRVLVLYGGRSAEHEVSVRSARLVADALQTAGHSVVGVGTTLQGRTVRCDPREVSSRVPDDAPPYTLPTHPLADRDADVAFPALHGPFGEDGCVQGLFELADLPYVGARVEGSVICMDKTLQKRMFAEAGLPVVEFVAFSRAEWEADAEALQERVSRLGFPCFAKPAHLGSSVGISKVRDSREVRPSIERALRHDDVVLAEAFGGPRELEVGVLGGSPPEVSVAGEAVAHADFYDYLAKYSDDGSELVVPADVPSAVYERMRRLAQAAFLVSRCEGLARVDFFWDQATGRLLVNEINSIPGMTPTSMFPRVWEKSGVPFHEVADRLVADAMRRHEHKAMLQAARAAAHDEEVGHADAGAGRGDPPTRGARSGR